MKKVGILFMATAISMISVLPVSALETSYGAAGCGLGSMLFGNQSGPVQVVAATTNGTSGNQTFGITSGTLNCGKGMLASGERLNAFVASNLDSLSLEIAKGKGESLQTVVEMMGVPAEQRGAVYAKLQNNYGHIFTSKDVAAGEVVDQMIRVIKS
ncbi:MAG: DUF3015 family protein [Nitrospirota bacterium]